MPAIQNTVLSVSDGLKVMRRRAHEATARPAGAS